MPASEIQAVDSLGRRRQPGQASGLKRPEPLPTDWQGRSVRINLPAADWAYLDKLIIEQGLESASMAMAMGRLVHELLEERRRTDEFRWSPDDWMEWERRKTLRLLRLAV